MPYKPLVEIGQFATGHGLIGGSHALHTAADKLVFSSGVRQHIRPLTKANTADCGDERRIMRLADGTGEDVIRRTHIVPQLFGGLALPVTKAMVAADTAMVRGLTNMQTAYIAVSALLSRLGYEDGGHADCGASGTVESSVADRLPAEQLRTEIGLFTDLRAADYRLLDTIARNQARRLRDEFYRPWSPTWHESYLAERYPQNFSYLAVDADDRQTKGHHASGLLIITEAGQGFAKDAMIADTGQEAFAVTVPLMRELARKLGQDERESRLIELALYDDTIRVGSGLVVSTLPVFA